MYYAKFDVQGERITSIVEGVHFNDEESLQKFINDGFIAISDEEQEMYATNKYIRDAKAGSPTLRPPYVPTAEDHANQIATKYNSQMVELKDALATATLAGDSETIEELKIEYANLMAAYVAELEEI